MKQREQYPQVLVLVGPTAIGKTALSLELALEFNCEIISVDSMQVYRYMDIGTAKASLEERATVPHHLIDVVDPDENYDAARFVKDATGIIGQIHDRGKLPLLTGGTGLYFKSLLEGIFPEAPSDPLVREELKKKLQKNGPDKLHEELTFCDSSSAKRIHKNDTQRLLRALEIFLISGVPWSEHLKRQKEMMHSTALEADILQIGLTCQREKLYKRINLRCELMLQAGLEEEVRGLQRMGYGPDLKSMGSIGYKHMCEYLNGSYDKDEMLRLLSRDTRRYAKRQYTWFNKNRELQWVDTSEPDRVSLKVKNWYRG